jgi:eukaryotic-like serine/threonine-protein kinase
MLQILTGQHIGRYEICGFLGRGAFSQVFKAQAPDGTLVALKIGADSGGGRFLQRFREITGERSPSGVSPDETPAEAMFLDPVDGARSEVLDATEVDELLWREAKLLKQAGGRGFPKIFEVVEVEDRPAIVMEFIEGMTLRERIRSLEGVKLAWLVEVAYILERVQAMGWLCHGDLKPENIIIGSDEKVTLLDPVPFSERSDLVVTTPWYNPFLRRDAKGDAQGLATILYELLSGALPYEQVPFRYAGCADSAGDPEERDLMLSLFLSFPRPRELNPRTPVEFDRMIYRAMADSNYTLSDLRMDMEDFLLKNN